MKKLLTIDPWEPIPWMKGTEGRRIRWRPDHIKERKVILTRTTDGRPYRIVDVSGEQVTHKWYRRGILWHIWIIGKWSLMIARKTNVEADKAGTPAMVKALVDLQRQYQKRKQQLKDEGDEQALAE